MSKALRTVAKIPVKTTEWLVILADKPGVLERRIQIRPVHSKAFVKLHETGFVSWAGPVFKEHVSQGIRPFIGSVMVVNAESPEKVRETLKQDVFVKEGIWDWAGVKIFPFRTTVRQPPDREE
ncbi:hypothetical protein ONS95_008947 [Cadophora gregata]|uniref:uncharacterized protein n=1 Tax=Cadophora gregata TaxID=51156 RepID=UPI0026DC921C|nr:uncharacterized protein ONS95_008947 [Cadophora gregata]KAK0123959.1 hypothetical protein ONS95_008947 [Cadophora gregata]KAK0130298.1 hypothetical protein ONS96_000819 [Cadophora gregata f. sp. sojae]